jgi:hypothetical protein
MVRAVLTCDPEAGIRALLGMALPMLEPKAGGE